MLAKAPAPPGFSISFSRHGKRWGWKQIYKAEFPELDTERWGFRRRRDALDDLHAEVAKREAAQQPQAAADG